MIANTTTHAPAPSARTARIAALDDACRRGDAGGGLIVTSGVAALGGAALLDIIGMVRGFDAFTADNDPHGEHDFGMIRWRDERLFWKIDCYDRQLRYGSPDPADPCVTTRVVTIMLAAEY